MSRMVQYTFAGTILGTQVGAVLDHTLQHEEICTFASVVQRSLVKVVAGIDVCTMLQQQANCCHVTAETCSM